MTSQITDTAYLSSQGRYTLFTFGEITLKFIAPYSLEKYSEIVEWDNGYIVVMAKYSHSEEEIEEYIDLVPILQELYMEESFLQPIKKVEVKYA